MTETAPLEGLVLQLYRLGPVSRALSRHAAAELGGQGFAALAVVDLAGPVRASAVSAQLAIDLSVASRQLAALAAAGHIVRQADPADGRAQLLRSTTQGREALLASHARMVAEVETALADWSPQDITTLTTLLARLRADVARVEGLPGPLKETP